MEADRERSRRYLSTPEGKEKNRIRKRKYMDLIRHIDVVLDKIMKPDDLLSLQEISNRVHESRHILLKPSTLQNLLDRYSEPPLEKTDDGSYRLNRDFYGTDRHSA